MPKHMSRIPRQHGLVSLFTGVRSGLRHGVQRLLRRSRPISPQVLCRTLKLGDDGYGAWSVCPDQIRRNLLIYSFGVGENISWDLAMIEHFGATVHAFDPTPRSIKWVKQQTLPGRFVLHEYGLADYDGKARFNPPENPDWVSHTMLDRPLTATSAIEVSVRCLPTIMATLNHDHVDLIKMDIEGAEYGVIANMLQMEPIVGGARQLLIEFHHRFPGKRMSDTQACVRSLNEKGFRCFDVSSTGEEWSFIRDD